MELMLIFKDKITDKTERIYILKLLQSAQLTIIGLM